MAGRRLVSALASLISIAVSAASAQRPAPKQQEVFAAYWSSEPGWDTEFQLENNLPSAPLTVTPVLRLASGEEIPLDPVTIASKASASVWANEQLLKHSPNLLSQPGSYGSVVFRFMAQHARNLYAESAPLLSGGPIGLGVDAYPTPESEPYASASLAGSLEGIWWHPRTVANDWLILSNSSGQAIAGTLWLSDQAGRRWSQRLPLAARQT
jgi:hypothetical protein